MNPDKKLVFIDLDGTLLDNSRKISAHSLRTIKKLEQSGSIPCIASGRPASMVRLYTHELGLNTPLISNNAANISLAGTILRQTCLPAEAGWEFLKYCFSITWTGRCFTQMPSTQQTTPRGLKGIKIITRSW